MKPTLKVGHYPTGGREEQFLRINDNNTTQVVFFESFFEERNFLRKTIVDIAHALAGNGVDSFIPDLPGCGESLVDLAQVDLADWRGAAADAVRWLGDQMGKPPHIASFRGGALIDDAVGGASWWRFAPCTGADLLRPLRRASSLAGAEGNWGGHAIQPAMTAELEYALPRRPEGPCRECPAEGNKTPLWRLAEPGEDPLLVRLLAEDLVAWIRTCGEA